MNRCLRGKSGFTNWNECQRVQEIIRGLLFKILVVLLLSWCIIWDLVELFYFIFSYMLKELIDISVEESYIFLINKFYTLWSLSFYHLETILVLLELWILVVGTHSLTLWLWVVIVSIRALGFRLSFYHLETILMLLGLWFLVVGTHSLTLQIQVDIVGIKALRFRLSRL